MEKKGNTDVISNLPVVSKTANEVNPANDELMKSTNNEEQSKDDSNNLEENIVHNVTHSLTTDSHPIGILAPPASVVTRSSCLKLTSSGKSGVRYIFLNELKHSNESSSVF